MRFFKRLFLPANQPLKDRRACDGCGLEVEYCAPIARNCECCDDVTTTLNRLFKRDGCPYAMCRITFSETHLGNPARGIFGIGIFGEGTSPDQRVAFAVVLRPDGVTIVDAVEADWPETDVLGPKLTREAALQHQRKGELFQLIDKLYAEDRLLNEHFSRVSAG